MARTSTHIETDSVLDIVNNWTQSVNDFDVNKPVAFSSGSDGFFRIKDAGFSTESIHQYDTNVERLSMFLRTYGTLISEYLNSMTDADIDIESKIPSIDKPDIVTDPKLLINTEDKVNEIKTSDMSDLSDEAEKVKKKNDLIETILKISTLNINPNILIDITNMLAEHPEYNDSNYKVTFVDLNNVNKAFSGFITDGGFEYSINKGNIKGFNNNYNGSFGADFDDSSYSRINKVSFNDYTPGVIPSHISETQVGSKTTQGAFSKFHNRNMNSISGSFTNSNINNNNMNNKYNTGSSYTTSAPTSVTQKNPPSYSNTPPTANNSSPVSSGATTSSGVSSTPVTPKVSSSPVSNGSSSTSQVSNNIVHTIGQKTGESLVNIANNIANGLNKGVSGVANNANTSTGLTQSSPVSSSQGFAGSRTVISKE